MIVTEVDFARPAPGMNERWGVTFTFVGSDPADDTRVGPYWCLTHEGVVSLVTTAHRSWLEGGLLLSVDSVEAEVQHRAGMERARAARRTRSASSQRT